MQRHFAPPTREKKSFPPLLLLAWAMLCILIGIGLLRSATRVQTAFDAKRQAASTLQKEEQKNAELLQKLQDSQNPLSEERMIRDELHKQRPGEQILLLPSPNP